MHNLFLGIFMLTISPVFLEGLTEEVSLEFSKNLNAKPQERPIFILIGGFQGSGKSSLAGRIKQIYDINVISTDAVRKSLFNKGFPVSPACSTYVSNIQTNLIKKSLSFHANTLIDANAHSKRIKEVETLLKENIVPYKLVKIFLKAGEDTLINRVTNRKTTLDCYQGTESDLKASLFSVAINPEEYDLTIDTDELNEEGVFEIVKKYLLYGA